MLTVRGPQMAAFREASRRSLDDELVDRIVAAGRSSPDQARSLVEFAVRFCRENGRSSRAEIASFVDSLSQSCSDAAQAPDAARDVLAAMEAGDIRRRLSLIRFF